MSLLSSYECIDSSYLEGLGFRVLFPNSNPPIATKTLQVGTNTIKGFSSPTHLVQLTYNGGTKLLHINKPHLNYHKSLHVEDGMDLFVALEKIREDEHII